MKFFSEWFDALFDLTPKILIGMDPLTTAQVAFEMIFEYDRLETLELVSKEEREASEQVIREMISNNAY